jgi:hypothetical protein
MRGRLKDLTFSRDGSQVVALTVEGDFRKTFDSLAGRDLDIDIKPHREKRSLSANAYFHLLCGKIAAALRSTPDEVKEQLVLDYGTIDEDPETGVVGFKLLAGIDVGRVCKYARLYEQREENGRLFNCYIVYKQTHEMNTAEMARLIDGAVQEAKDLGIETDTPETIERLRREWEKHQQHHAG